MPKPPLKLEIPLSQAEKYAKGLAATIKGGEVIALIGDLGSGKTTFTKALGKALGIKHSIPSPTFVMMQEFEVPKKKLFLYHLDLYRAKNFAEVKSLGITHWWGRPETVTVIEWADKIIKDLPANTKIIYLYRDQD
jgi:tRNA threonylcarbamoyladenosine biosynthesis protein TsaE